MLRIERYCGKERLPGGERRWRRLARRAGFDGRVQVFGWGVKEEPGRLQRQAARTGKAATVADYEPGLIRVWMPCACDAVDYYDEEENTARYVLGSFAHELGHHRQYLKGRDRWTSHAESSAERYGRFLLRSTP